MRTLRSLGVDVGVRHLDVVCLNEARVVAVVQRIGREDLPRIIGDLNPDVIAVDSPSQWAREGNSRLAERELARLGIQSFRTPGDPAKQESAFYGWMKAGFEVYKLLDSLDFPLYQRGPLGRHAIEIFPYATAVTLSGHLRPKGQRKKLWRLAILQSQNVDVRLFTNQDSADGALAALTGLISLTGTFSAIGEADEGVIVLPISGLPSARCVVGAHGAS